MLIAIDPGASGGIAYLAAPDDMDALRMPPTMTEQVDMLRELSLRCHNAKVLMEKVGTYMPGNSGPAAAKFAGHCDGLRYACYALGIPMLPEVTPQRWQKALGFGVARYLPADYKTMTGTAKQRAHSEAVRKNKNDIKDAMQRQFPHLRVTLATADALAILVWGDKYA